MIEVSQLSKSYGPRIAVENLTFKVKKGEIVGFLGPNGAGKTTAMKILTGFMPPTSGTATVGGHDVLKNSLELKRIVGYLPESPPVYLDMQVDDYLRYAARLHDVPSRYASRAVDSAIEKVGLGDVQKRLIGNLSKGFRQRVGLAQALVHNPETLILDEPTVGLDPAQIMEIRELIKSLAGDHTVILSTHILPEVQATCPRVIVINQGRMVADDRLDVLTSKFNKGLNFTLSVKEIQTSGIEKIRQLPSVEKLTVEDVHLHITLKEDALSGREKIVESAVQNGMGVLEFREERLSLEEIFIHLTHPEQIS
jgi:ABC-2 type transport system ATP-binding protein